VGQQLAYSDDWIGLDTTGLVVQFSSNMTNEGYTMDVVLDQFCPYIWGYDRIITTTLYAGTHGEGVWRSSNLGIVWEDITTNIPDDSHYVRGISASGSIVWAATISGVYHTANGEAYPASGVYWDDRTPTPLPGGVTVIDWTDVQMQPSNSDVVYVLAHADGSKYMFKTSDNGSSWNYVEIY
jgi:hypothetical protein